MKKACIIGAAFIFVFAVLLLVFTSGYDSAKDGGTESSADVREFEVKAFRFGYSPDTITVNKGDKVRIIIENTDTLHGIRIPSLGLAGNDAVELSADKEGEFEWFCNNMCGQGHREMKGRLVVS
ncbi:MAG TPA: hypothetical protein HA362_01040 [Nanoarchaeota archaeon]|nr:hypothetical protein [Nanoarchaeota archaeon]